MLQGVAGCFSMLQCVANVATCYSVLQCAAVCVAVFLLVLEKLANLHVAGYCRGLHCAASV